MKIFVLVAILFGFFWEAAMVWLDARWQRTHALPECVQKGSNLHLRIPLPAHRL